MHSSEEYLGQKANSVFKFTAVNEDCIDEIIMKFKSKSSTGYDNISNKLIKHYRTVLVKPLTLLANQIIHTGEFPRQLKIARVKPLYRKGDETSFSNYRPISLLPSISKIFENVMAAQLLDYFTTQFILYSTVWLYALAFHRTSCIKAGESFYYRNGQL